MHSQLSYLLQICIQWTKLAIYFIAAAGSRAALSKKPNNVTRKEHTVNL